VVSGDEIYGIRHGYEGLLNEEFFRNPNGLPTMGTRCVSGLSRMGGTILSSSRSKRFETLDGLKRAVEVLKRHRIDALIPIGGNGTMAGALDLSKIWDGQIIGLPGTIDNDLLGTHITIGFSTAVDTAVEAVDKLRDTAGSHDLMFFVEVMGRHCGDIAVETAIASGAELVFIPEEEEATDKVIRMLRRIKDAGKLSVMAIVAEGDEHGGAFKLQKILSDAGNPFESRCVVLGHVQRGGSPVPRDRVLATELGNFAIGALIQGETGKMAGRVRRQTTLTPLEECVAGHKQVDPDRLRLLHIVGA